MARDLRVLVIGAGMAGILSVIRCRQIGLPDVTVYEKADRLGGTWRENRYPGVACDVPSHLYSYSFAPNPEWTHRFSPGPEIQEYLEAVAAECDVDRDIRYGEEVTDLRWDGRRWHLRTASGIVDEGDVVIAATGVLHHPSYPDVDGLGDFAGITMHTARWDESLPLAGRRVGIIGTVPVLHAASGEMIGRWRTERRHDRRRFADHFHPHPGTAIHTGHRSETFVQVIVARVADAHLQRHEHPGAGSHSPQPLVMHVPPHRGKVDRPCVLEPKVYIHVVRIVLEAHGLFNGHASVRPFDDGDQAPGQLELRTVNRCRDVLVDLAVVRQLKGVVHRHVVEVHAGRVRALSGPVEAVEPSGPENLYLAYCESTRSLQEQAIAGCLDLNAFVGLGNVHLELLSNY